MKRRLSFIIPLILVIVALANAFALFLEEERENTEEIRKEAFGDITFQMGVLQNVLYNRLSEGNREEALLNLSLAATFPGIRTLLLADDQHRILMANRYIWKGGEAAAISRYRIRDAVLALYGGGTISLAFNPEERTLLQGYFPIVTQHYRGGQGKQMGLLYVEYDIAGRLESAKAMSLRQATLFGAITVGAALAIALILHFLVSRRAKVLVDASSRLAAGDYTARTELEGNDELAELGKTFDAMARKIKENIAVGELERERLSEAQKIGRFGSWELDLVTGKLHWSDEIFRMFEIDPAKFPASYEAFINAIHPADRERVNRAYKDSLENRLSYQITHRLLMPDGRTKWVEERCTSHYDSAGKPLRSLGTVQDVTQRENDEQQLRIAAAAFETQEAILVTDRDSNIIRVNRSFEAITGYSFADVVGKNPRILSSGRQGQEFYRQMWAVINSEGRWSGEIWDRRKNGEIYPKWLTITSVNKNGEITHYVGVFVDISERKRAEEEIRLLAFYDPLTKLPNRRQLMERLHTALALSQRSRQYGSLMFLDLDHFKVLNDTKGHGVGDLMLIEVANRVSGCVRESDTVARLGGDEFVVLLEGLGAKEDEAFTRAAQVAEKIRASLTRPYDLDGYIYESSPSIGVALFLGNDIGIDDLLKRADLAMYQSKETGRNAFRFFEPRMQATLEARSQMEHALRHAMANGELSLHYQLQTNRSKELLGAEVLLRWDSPLLGRVPPAQFIPLAEQTRLILPIGCWVLETACQKLKEWERHPIASKLYLAVNISPAQFHQMDFVNTVKAVLARTAINPARLELELTENLVLENVDIAIEKITALRNIGVRFSMDDFGTGYSSLQFIKRLPINTLKIDQSFVRDILTDPGDAVMVQTITGLAHNFGFDVIAEGVETEEQLAPLIERGCATFQGYLFSKPVPMAEFERLIEKWEQREPQ